LLPSLEDYFWITYQASAHWKPHVQTAHGDPDYLTADEIGDRRKSPMVVVIGFQKRHGITVFERFYEKVIKVKADVAALSHLFSLHLAS
jgi:hypothetical protein